MFIMKNFKHLLLLVLLCQTPILLQSGTLEDFYKKAFGDTSNQKRDIFLPLVINGNAHTEIFIIKEGQNIYLKKETIEYIIDLLKPEYKDNFPYQIDKNKNGFISSKYISKEGITITFDESKIVLKIVIPPKLKKAQSINLRRNYTKKGDKITQKEDYSGGATLYLNQNYSEEKDEFKRLPLTGSSEIFFNIHDVVIEGEIRFDEEDEDKIRRDRVRLTKDDEKNQLRYQMGDLFLPQLNRMTRREALGISMEKIFDMDENYHQNISRINSFEFFLKNRSRIEIYINDRFSRNLNLDAGTHNLYDLNIPTGLNRVKLKVIQESGKVEYIEFNDFDYSELYKEGVSRFGIGVGIESNRDNNEQITYDKEEKIASLYGEYGVNSFLTLKASSELKSDYKSLMIEPIVGTPIGLFDIYAINSYQKQDKKEGSKYGINYRTNIGNINLSLNAEQIGKEFTSINNYNELNSSLESNIYQGTIYTPFIYNSSLSFTASKYKKDDENREEYSMDLRKAFTSNFDVLVSYDYNKDMTNNSNSHEVYLSLNYRYGNVNARYGNYIEEQKHQLNFSHRTEGYYGLNSNFDIEETPINQRVALRSDLKNEKFRINSNYTYSTQKESSSNNQNLNMQLATGIYFAGDTFSVSEPINSSYIIVENEEKLDDTPLGIIGYQDIDDEPYSSFVVQNSDYRTKKMIINEINLPEGMTIISPEQHFSSTYKSGSVMKIEADSFYSVKGRLIEPNGKAIALRAFKVYNPQTGGKEMAFTDEKGAFRLGKIEMGEYNVILFRKKGEDDISKFSFSIKEENIIKNIIDIGDITVKLSKI